MQQELEHFLRPVRDLVGLVGSQVNVLGQRARELDTANSDEASQAFSATQDSQIDPEAARSSASLMPPPKPQKKRKMAELQHTAESSDDDLFEDEALIAACNAFQDALKPTK